MEHPLATGLLGVAVATLYIYFVSITVFGSANRKATGWWKPFRLNLIRLGVRRAQP